MLAVLQGLTEFLPVSSSGHLLLPAALLGWQDQGLTLDIAVHLGTLVAVILYLRRDLMALAAGSCRWLLKRVESDESRLALKLLVATLPAGLAGLALRAVIEANARSLAIVACRSIRHSKGKRCSFFRTHCSGSAFYWCCSGVRFDTGHFALRRDNDCSAFSWFD